MEDQKAWWSSKTIWASVVGGAALLAGAFGVHVLDDPAAQAEIVGVAMAIVGVVLRFKTSAPIK
jgi:hypothetical protein